MVHGGDDMVDGDARTIHAVGGAAVLLGIGIALGQAAGDLLGSGDALVGIVFVLVGLVAIRL